MAGAAYLQVVGAGCHQALVALGDALGQAVTVNVLDVADCGRAVDILDRVGADVTLAGYDELTDFETTIIPPIVGPPPVHPLKQSEVEGNIATLGIVEENSRLACWR